MIIILVLSVWIIVGFFLFYVVEPYCRLRLNVVLADDKTDQEISRLVCSMGWPFAMFIYPLIRFVLFPLSSFFSNLTDRIDQYWATLPTVKTKAILVDEAKTGYRNVKFFEEK